MCGVSEPDQKAIIETARQILEEEFVRWCIEDGGLSEQQANASFDSLKILPPWIVRSIVRALEEHQYDAELAEIKLSELKSKITEIVESARELYSMRGEDDLTSGHCEKVFFLAEELWP